MEIKLSVRPKGRSDATISRDRSSCCFRELLAQNREAPPESVSRARLEQEGTRTGLCRRNPGPAPPKLSGEAWTGRPSSQASAVSPSSHRGSSASASGRAGRGPPTARVGTRSKRTSVGQPDRDRPMGFCGTRSGVAMAVHVLDMSVWDER